MAGRPAPHTNEHPPDLPEVSPGAHLFRHSAERVVGYLARHTPLHDWSVSRVEDGVQLHLHVSDGATHGGTPMIEVGQRVPWDDTFCHRMVGGAAHVVPDSSHDPGYADLPAAARVRSYVGMPISDEDGDLFGILCGVGAEPLTGSESVDADLVQLFADLLSAQLVASREQDRLHSMATAIAAEAQLDHLTGLLNRRGWDLVLAEAHERCRTYGDQASVAVIDLDNLKRVNDSRGHVAGDELLRRAADVLAVGVRAEDSVARQGGDEFSVLGRNITEADQAAWVERLRGQLEDAGIEASVGVTLVLPEDPTPCAAFQRADAAMYVDKARRRRR